MYQIGHKHDAYQNGQDPLNYKYRLNAVDDRENKGEKRDAAYGSRAGVEVCKLGMLVYGINRRIATCDTALNRKQRVRHPILQWAERKDSYETGQ